MLAESDPIVLSDPLGSKLSGLVKGGHPDQAYDGWRAATREGKNSLVGNRKMIDSAWQRLTAAAEKYNQPGRFTALIGYEWTSIPKGNNLHRNVVFRDGKAKADQVGPFPAEDSTEDLWKWMAAYEQKTGGKLLAIPHNGNLSNGWMFDDVTLTTKKPLDRDYAGAPHALGAALRGVPDEGNRRSSSVALDPRRVCGLRALGQGVARIGRGEDARHAPQRVRARGLRARPGLRGEAGVNPFKFGMVGSTDSHASLATTEENNFFGKIVALEPVGRPHSLRRGRGRPGKEPRGQAGRAIRAADECVRARGRVGAEQHAQAMRDPEGANLDRVQVVKGWLGAEGKTHEQVYDVAWSENRKAGADGKLPAVGNTVNVPEATYSNSIGAPYLSAFWKDPSFDPKQRAFYYVRVLEIPTPRGTTFDAKVFKVALPKDVPASIQERAYTSPIWYTP